MISSNLSSPSPATVRPAAILAVLAGLLLTIAPLAARAGHRTSAFVDGYSTDEDGSSFGWAVFDPGEGSSSISCNTGRHDWREIQRLLRDEDAPALWFELDDRAYLVRDPALVARAWELAGPLRDLGRRQGELGARQGKLGGRQGALGARQAALGARQAGYGLTRRERAQIQTELARSQAELGRLQAELGRAQAELGREQAALGRRQAQLSREISGQMLELVRDAIEQGKAERVRVRRSV